MKLYYSPASPYARKCRVLVREKDALAAVEEIPVTPLENPDALLAANPAAQVPTLETQEDGPITGSDLICDYLDAKLDGPSLHPAGGAARWRALQRQSYADAVMDASVRLNQENQRDATLQSPFWRERWLAAIDRGLDVMEAAAAETGDLTIGEVAIAIALDYIDFRHPGVDWRGPRPRLTDFLERLSVRPSLAETAPKA